MAWCESVWMRGLFSAGCGLLLASCGGGGGGAGSPVLPTPPASGAECSVLSQNTWLRDYMNEWYFWYRIAPSPDPAAYTTRDAYFDAALYTGSDPAFPRDRYSFSETTARFNQFYGEGKTLGYGVFVAGVEVTGRPDLPLKVRYIEPLSDAAARGVKRGDQVLSINGRSASDIITANDFSALTPAAEGNTLTLQLRNAGVDRSVTLTASAYTLSPVTGATVLNSPGGRRMGYVSVKDMISQASPGLQSAFTQFRSAGVNELIIDLRYNGGGLVSMGGEVASYAAGARANGQVFTSLVYNDKRAASNNENFRFTAPASALGLSRVFVLMGSRTCSASELVINGLRGVGVDVVTIGGTSCGKPVGFLPKSNCDTTFNVVNFESVNARNEGRYFNGIAPTCAVADDVSRPLGAVDEALVAAARRYADGGGCPAGSSRESAESRPAVPTLIREPGERSGMLGR
jgi:carboxyl-terminal processing protease